MTAFVPAHRCGAVPDSHRVPSYDTQIERTIRTTHPTHLPPPAPAEWAAAHGTDDRLTKGETQRGCVTFEVGKKATIERIRFAASSGFGSAAEWKVG